MKKKTNSKTLKKVLHFIGRYKIMLLISILLAAITVALQLYVPILFGDAIDQIIAEGKVDFTMISHYLGIIFVLVSISAICSWVMGMVNNHMAYGTTKDIRDMAIEHVQKLPLSYLDKHSSGDIVSRVVADAGILSDGLLLGFTQIFTGVITIIGTLFFMFSKNIWITLLVIVLTPLSFGVAKFISTHSFQMFLRQSKARGEQTALIDEMMNNQKVVKAFGYEKRASEKFSVLNKELQDASQKAVFYSSLTNPGTRFVNNIIYAAVAMVGAFMIPGGMLTVGGLSVMLSYANQYMKPFNDISSVVTELQNALACAERIFELLEEQPESEDSKMELYNVEGEVSIEDISFSYTKEKELIRNFSLNVNPGMRIAIVGPTGCGKTTFINLLMRFYDVDSGKIEIDGKKINEVSRHSLRSNFGMVLQDTWIKKGTVRENLNIGRPNATDEEIKEAAKLARSWDFIRRMPKGLDTMLTEDSLSQGEKQLLCITRVMLCLPPMLILDEATSSIDTRTEIKIQEAFDQMMKGRTSFIVAHRLSTIRNADCILVMKDGRIIEQGTHKELIAQKGFYHKLYYSQFAAE